MVVKKAVLRMRTIFKKKLPHHLGAALKPGLTSHVYHVLQNVSTLKCCSDLIPTVTKIAMPLSQATLSQFVPIINYFTLSNFTAVCRGTTMIPK